MDAEGTRPEPVHTCPTSTHIQVSSYPEYIHGSMVFTQHAALSQTHPAAPITPATALDPPAPAPLTLFQSNLPQEVVLTSVCPLSVFRLGAKKNCARGGDACEVMQPPPTVNWAEATLGGSNPWLKQLWHGCGLVAGASRLQVPHSCVLGLDLMQLAPLGSDSCHNAASRCRASCAAAAYAERLLHATPHLLPLWQVPNVLAATCAAWVDRCHALAQFDVLPKGDGDAAGFDLLWVSHLCRRGVPDIWVSGRRKVTMTWVHRCVTPYRWKVRKGCNTGGIRTSCIANERTATSHSVITMMTSQSANCGGVQGPYLRPSVLAGVSMGKLEPAVGGWPIVACCGECERGISVSTGRIPNLGA